MIRRTKISQKMADELLEDPDCDLSSKDVGYLDFKGKDLTHCVMVNTSFFGVRFKRGKFIRRKFTESIFKFSSS